MKKIYSEMDEEELEEEFKSYNIVCDICKNEIDSKTVKTVAAYESNPKTSNTTGWRQIFTKICCDKCYDRISIEAGASGIF